MKYSKMPQIKACKRLPMLCLNAEMMFFFRLENHLSVIGDMNVVWHRSCYQTITSKSHIARSTVKIDADADVNLTKSKPQPMFTLSALTPLDPSLCLFCQEVYCKREKKGYTFTMQSIKTYSRSSKT